MTGRKPVTRISATITDASLASSVTHDFSQPLSTVTSLSDLLVTDWAELTEDVRRDLAARIDGASRALAVRFRQMAMVMDLLAGRVRAGGSADVRAAVTAAATGPTGVAGPSIAAAVDRDHLEHVIATLLADAAEPVRVRVVPTADSVTVAITRVDPPVDTIARMVGGKTLGRPRSRALGIAIAARLLAIDGGFLTRDRHGRRITLHLPRLASGSPG